MVFRFRSSKKRTDPGYSANFADNIKRMQVTDSMVEKIADLAKLSFTEQEKVEIRADLEKLIAFVDQLKTLDLEGVEPMLHMSDAVNVWREDRPGGSAQRADALLNAPESAGPYFTVPKVIKK